MGLRVTISAWCEGHVQKDRPKAVDANWEESKMTKLTRQALLKQASVGAATVGALVAMPGLASAHAAPAVRATGRSRPTQHEPLAAYVRDRATGEIALLVGTREIIVRDPELVMRLVKAAQ